MNTFLSPRMDLSLQDPLPQASLAYPPAWRAWRAWTILIVVVAATVFSYVDRTILSLLVGPVRHDMKITDLQMSYLLGPAFAIFFATMGLPLGWAADHGHRLKLAAAGVAIWSLMTVLSGFSHEYWQLFVTRIGVATGEAVLMPTANSLIVDCFGPHRRTRMLGVLGMAIYWGIGFAFLFGGLLINYVASLAQSSILLAWFKPWQLVFVVVGAPGLLVALALALLQEPNRQPTIHAARLDPAFGDAPSRVPMRRKLSDLIGNYGGLFVACGLMAVVGYSLTAWAPSQLVRVYGWTAGAAGVRLGAGVLASTTVCIWIAATLADRMAARGRHDAKYIVAGCFTLAAAPVTAALGLVHNATFFVVAFAVAFGAASTCIGMGPAAVCDITPMRMRGRALGAYQLTVAFIGGAFGAPLVALGARLSLSKAGGLAPALCVVTTAGFLIASAIFWIRREAFARASRTVHLAE